MWVDNVKNLYCTLKKNTAFKLKYVLGSAGFLFNNFVSLDIYFESGKNLSAVLCVCVYLHI